MSQAFRLPEVNSYEHNAEMHEAFPAPDTRPTHDSRSVVQHKSKGNNNYVPVSHGAFLVTLSAFPIRKENYDEDEERRALTKTIGDLTATFSEPPESIAVKAFKDSIRILSMPARQLFFRICEVLTQKMTPSKYEQGKLIEETEADRKEKRTVYLSIKEYIEERGKGYENKNQRKEARKVLNDALLSIHRMELTWKGKGIKIWRRYVFSEQRIEGDYIKVVFNEDFYAMLKSSGLMQIPVSIRSISDKRPNAFSMCVKMFHHLSMDPNIGRKLKVIDARKEEAEKRHLELPESEEDFELRTGSLTVKTLLDYCSDLPKFADLKKEKVKGSAKQKILTPFYENLQFLAGTLPKKDDTNKPLESFSIWTPTPNRREIEKEEFINMNFRDAEKCLVTFTAKQSLPEARERLAKKEQARQERIARAKRAAEKKKAKEKAE